MSVPADLLAHLQTGATTTARAWAVARTDGVTLGFTDHDCDFSFDGVTFRADTGMTAMALQKGTGLAVDNSEAMGALQSDALSDADIDAGRYDGADVTVWIVNWQDVSERHVLFRGSIGEIGRAGGAFRAELRGLTEALNRPTGRVFQMACPAQLGDAKCAFDTNTAGFRWQGSVSDVGDDGAICLGDGSGFAGGWFRRGVLSVTSGAAAGLTAIVKRDETIDGQRWITPWTALGAQVAAGDGFEIVAGCDKRFATCQSKFNNVLNFRGFPDLPEDDWVVVHPASRKESEGGSRR